MDDALNAFDKFRNTLNKKYSIQDRMAISKALEAINQVHMVENFNLNHWQQEDLLQQLQHGRFPSCWEPL